MPAPILYNGDVMNNDSRPYGTHTIPADAEWRVVRDYPKYEVNQYGQVRRSETTRQGSAGSLLRGCRDRSGPKSYIAYDLSNGASHQKLLAHRLVAWAFLPPPSDPSQIFVAHNDGTRDNNHVSNLRWATPKENIHDNWRNGVMLIGEAHGCAKLDDGAVREIRRLYRKHAKGCGAPTLAARFGVSIPTILRVVKRRTWNHVE